MKNCYHLDIDTANAIKVDLWELLATKQDASNLPAYEGSMTAIPCPVYDLFNQSWISYVEDILELKMYNLGWTFYRTGVAANPTAHVDISSYSVPPIVCNYAFNFVVTPENDNSEMVWYSDSWDIDDMSTCFNRPVTQLNEIERCVLRNDKLSIINSGLLHDVDTNGVERWAVSFRDVRSWDPDYKYKSYQDQVNRLSQLII